MSETNFRKLILELPFVKQLEFADTEPFLDLWHVKPTGDWSNDCALGRQYAIETMQLIRRTEAYSILGPIRQATVTKAITMKLASGIETGFAHAMAVMATRGVL